MNKNKALLTGLLIMAPVFTAFAASQTATGCEAKRQDIEQQLRHAREHSNAHRAAGLEKALSELNANCTDEGLRAAREDDVRKKEQKVAERRQELAEAQADGREDKIRKKQQKLADAQAELAEAKSMLDK
nr:DUF1090 domain-containing protein [Intestinirhabdus alba]